MAKPAIQKKQKIALIGTGPAGSGFVFGLLDELRTDPSRAQNLELHIFEKSEVLGVGLPYDWTITAPEHLLNTHTFTGNLPNEGKDFFAWIKKNNQAGGLIETRFRELLEQRLARKFKTRFKKDYDPKAQYQGAELELCQHYEKVWKSLKLRYLHEDGAAFHPRILYGIYAAENFGIALEELKKLGVSVVPHKQTEVVALDQKLNLGFRNLAQSATAAAETIKAVGAMQFDMVAVFSGRMEVAAEVNSQNYISEIWPYTKLEERLTMLEEERRKTGLKIGIEGSSLSAIDMVKTVAMNFGNFETKGGKLVFTLRPGMEKPQIDMISRSGQLQVVKGSFAELDEQRKKFPAAEGPVEKQMAEFLRKRESEGKPIYLWEMMEIAAIRIRDLYQQAGRTSHGSVELLKLIEASKKKAGGKPELFDYQDISKFLMKSSKKNEAFGKLASDLTAAEEDSALWQHIYVSLDRVVVEYPSGARKFPSSFLSLEEKIYRIQLLKRYHSINSEGMPPESARELLALHEVGILNTVALGNDPAKPQTKGNSVVLGGTEYDLVVKTRGHVSDRTKTSSLLVTSMLRSGVIDVGSEVIFCKEADFAKRMEELKTKFGAEDAKLIASNFTKNQKGEMVYRDGVGAVKNDNVLFVPEVGGIGSGINRGKKLGQDTAKKISDKAPAPSLAGATEVQTLAPATLLQHQP